MSQNLVKEALECTEAIGKVFKDNKSVAERYSTRARRFATDLYVLGPAYVLALVAARSSKEAVEAGLKSDSCEKAVKEAENRGESDEEKSYGVYGAVFLYVLKKIGALKATTYRLAVEELLQRRPYEAYQVAEWLKLLAEAYFRGGNERNV